MKKQLRRLERQLDRLSFQLQFIEMEMGPQYMLASPLYQEGIELEAQCQKLRDGIAKARK
jgi:BioD-like phosphotransacetylase family protein